MIFKRYLDELRVTVTSTPSYPSADDIRQIGRSLDRLRTLRDSADTYIYCLKANHYHWNVFNTLQHLILNECPTPQSVRDDGSCYWISAKGPHVGLSFDNQGIPTFEFNHSEVDASVAISVLKLMEKEPINYSDLNRILIEAINSRGGTNE